ncbi:Ribonucleoside-diphosphate reductase NrdZ [Planctomycetes bacterium Pla163]|uniref:Ribonucleoside-diphosphate reductase NrdZ n=1 Tax=Rohdeia mirabilis TaxID=2528008 RepID=A0A518D532_9BACT|nr:Ribonucleoside-diphosphate reductase NrdZ [Planctomycetes bacterium Pla163]
MDPVHAPELPTAGRAIDLEGWARFALSANGASNGRRNGHTLGREASGGDTSGNVHRSDAHETRTAWGDAQVTTGAWGTSENAAHRTGESATRSSRSSAQHPLGDDVADVLWRTVWDASIHEVDRSSAARSWFDDLALGRVVLPGHVVVRAASSAFDGHAPWATAALHGGGPSQLRPVGADGLAELLARPAGPRSSGIVVTDRARWIHPALRAAAVGVDGPPFVHGWINLAAFVVPGPRSAFGPRAGGRPGGAVDWVELRAAVLRAVRLFDGLLDVHGGSGRAPDVDLAWRRIGIGMGGLGLALERLGIDPGSEAAALQARRLALCIDDHAHRASVELGNERGVFPRFGETLWARKGLPRRHGLCTSSWSSGGLLVASGLGEGLVASDVDVPPALTDQLRVQLECQRAFEGVVEIELTVGPNHDARIFQRVADERDLQCVRCIEPRAAAFERRTPDELEPARFRADRGEGLHGYGDPGYGEFGSVQEGRGSNGSSRDHDGPSSHRQDAWGTSDSGVAPRADDHGNAFSWGRSSTSHAAGEPDSPASWGTRSDVVRESPAYTIAPALRLVAETERGRFSLDVVYDEDGDRELEVVLVKGPAGSDGWRLIERVNSELDRGTGLSAALSASVHACPAAPELARVLAAFAERDRSVSGDARS